jgi:hypothetical protein
MVTKVHFATVTGHNKYLLVFLLTIHMYIMYKLSFFNSRYHNYILSDLVKLKLVINPVALDQLPSNSHSPVQLLLPCITTLQLCVVTLPWQHGHIPQHTGPLQSVWSWCSGDRSLNLSIIAAHVLDQHSESGDIVLSTLIINLTDLFGLINIIWLICSDWYNYMNTDK